MGVLVPGGDRTAVKRTADFFLSQFTERLEAQVGQPAALCPALCCALERGCLQPRRLRDPPGTRRVGPLKCNTLRPR